MNGRLLRNKSQRYAGELTEGGGKGILIPLPQGLTVISLSQLAAFPGEFCSEGVTDRTMVGHH